MDERDRRAEVLNFMRRYGNAYRENDVAEIRALRDPTFVWTSSRGRRMSTEEEMTAISSGNSQVHQSEVRQMDARVYGDAAVAIGNIWIEGLWQGAPYSGELAITATLVRSSSGWLMVAEHSSAVQPPLPRAA